MFNPLLFRSNALWSEILSRATEQQPAPQPGGQVEGYSRPQGGGNFSGNPISYLANMGDIFKIFGGGGETSGAATGGQGVSGPGGYGGPMGYAGIVGAAIAAQHAMSKGTDRRFEGQATKDAFGGSYGTEPWLAFSYDKLGIKKPSAGESFDAAVQNKNWASAARRSPAMLGYWAEPGTSVAYDVVNDKLGGTAAKALLPMQWLLRIFK